jgi:hypothetical protein
MNSQDIVQSLLRTAANTSTVNMHLVNKYDHKDGYLKYLYTDVNSGEDLGLTLLCNFLLYNKLNTLFQIPPSVCYLGVLNSDISTFSDIKQHDAWNPNFKRSIVYSQQFFSNCPTNYTYYVLQCCINGHFMSVFITNTKQKLIVEYYDSASEKCYINSSDEFLLKEGKMILLYMYTIYNALKIRFQKDVEMIDVANDYAEINVQGNWGHCFLWATWFPFMRVKGLPLELLNGRLHDINKLHRLAKSLMFIIMRQTMICIEQRKLNPSLQFIDVYRTNFEWEPLLKLKKPYTKQNLLTPNIEESYKITKPILESLQRSNPNLIPPSILFPEELNVYNIDRVHKYIVLLESVYEDFKHYNLNTILYNISEQVINNNDIDEKVFETIYQRIHEEAKERCLRYIPVNFQDYDIIDVPLSKYTEQFSISKSKDLSYGLTAYIASELLHCEMSVSEKPMIQDLVNKINVLNDFFNGSRQKHTKYLDKAEKENIQNWFDNIQPEIQPTVLQMKKFIEYMHQNASRIQQMSFDRFIYLLVAGGFALFIPLAYHYRNNIKRGITYVRDKTKGVIRSLKEKMSPSPKTKHK